MVSGDGQRNVGRGSAPALRLGALALVVMLAVLVAAWWLRPVPSVRYVASAPGVSATVALRIDATVAPPATLTIDLGNGVRMVASRLP